ncbi:MAG: NAD(P)/FAD-dependent oxidoreductase, partial [Actinobacteria bacterium]|nr:NAD(P)/FAD-dependent oxidoreductase [Actinomycetota bacterium]
MVMPVADFDAVVVGAGFAGLYMLHKLRTLGLTARVYDRAAGVGGTWYWNRYPGARCDIESLAYSYSFDPDLEREWNWTERYPAQPEILRYLNHVADRFDLRDDIQLETTVRAAAFDEAANTWTVETGRGGGVTARFLILATGCLSDAQIPAFPGLDSFAGERYHTGRWPHEGVDFTGKRVAVIGTGSSAIQSIPVIAAQADHTYVLQRTPNYSLPANNAPLDGTALRETQQHYDELRRRIMTSPLYFP